MSNQLLQKKKKKKFNQWPWRTSVDVQKVGEKLHFEQFLTTVAVLVFLWNTESQTQTQSQIFCSGFAYVFTGVITLI